MPKCPVASGQPGRAGRRRSPGGGWAGRRHAPSVPRWSGRRRLAAGACGRAGQRVVRGVAGCAPAVTRSATAWRGVAGGDQALADEHRVGAGRRVADQVVRAADAGLGHLHHARRAGPGAIFSNVDRSTSSVVRSRALTPMTDGAGLQRAVGLGLGVHLDQRGHAQGLDPLQQADERVLLQRGDDQQDDVGAVRPGLVHLVAADDEVLAQDRDVDDGADGVEVGLRAAEAAPLGEHADHPGAAGGVLARPARPGRGCRPGRPWRGCAA